MGPAAKDDVEHTMVLEHVNPTTRLLEKRRLMRETEETLDARKAEYKLKEQGFKRREEALKRKDLELQESSSGSASSCRRTTPNGPRREKGGGGDQAEAPEGDGDTRADQDAGEPSERPRRRQGRGGEGT